MIAVFCLFGCGKEPWVLKSPHPDHDVQTVRQTPHQVALLEDGRTALLYRLSALRQARQSIRIQTFILTDDHIGILVLEELIRAAKRGVKVQVISDALFTNLEPERQARLLRQANGMEIRLYNPPTDRIDPDLLSLGGRAVTDLRGLNQRMHNKLLIVDDHVAICGGRNIADEYYDADFKLNFLDLDIVVKGPVVQDMVTSFKRYWNSPLVVPLRLMVDVPSVDPERRDRTSLLPSWTGALLDLEPKFGYKEPPLQWHHVERVAFWADPPYKPDPEEDPEAIAFRLARLLRHTREDLLLQSPYLVLSDQAIALFRSLHERKVRIRISTNSLSATDNWLSYAHSLRQRRTMLQDLNFQIYEMKAFPGDLRRYMPQYDQLLQEAGRIPFTQFPGHPDPKLCLHTKALVIDKEITMVGTYNLDPRSAYLNTENGVAVWDSQFAQYMTSKIEGDMHPTNSWAVAKRPLPLPLEPLQVLLEEVNELAMTMTSLDVWPLRYSSLFELKEGMTPVPPGHPEFYQRYRAVGLFPGMRGPDLKPILVELTRTLTGSFRPLI